MSLLEEAMSTCVMLKQAVRSDGYGGYITDWAEGDTFAAAIVFDTSIEAREAEAAGVTSRYTVTTRKDFTLAYHDVFRRESDGKVFRVTSDGDDKFTPASAALSMRIVTAEEFELPNG